MLNTASKVEAILDAWLQFIRLEELSSAEVPSDEAEYNNIKLSSNNLLIEENLFARLQGSYALGKRGQQEITWVASFPQIYRVEDGKSVFYPLFSLDVTPIIRGSYQAQGWSVEDFDMVEAGKNLALLLKLDEEQLDRLITKEGLRRFLETTFDIEFQSFEDWMRQVSLQEHYVIKRPYLFEFKGGSFSFNLKKDLKAIKKSQDKHWLNPGHPAHEYLFGIPKPPANETVYLGAFPTPYPPTDSQLKVLKHAQAEPITAVQGPPGSGKTTLILHLIAQQVVSRALSLIETGKDINNLTVVSSTNDQAVKNVIDRLNEDLPDGFLYLRGGSKKIIDRADGAKEQLQNALDFLQSSSFDETQQQTLAQQIKQLKQDLISYEYQYQEMRKQRQTDETRLLEAQQEIQVIQQQLADANLGKEQLERRAASLAHYENLPEDAYRHLQFQFNTVRLELSEATPPWWINWIYWLFGRTERQVLAKLARRCQATISQTLGTSFEIKPPLDRRALLRQSQCVEEGLVRLQELKTVQADFEQRSQDTVDINHKREERLRELDEIDGRLAVPLAANFYNTFHTQYHEQQCAMFDLSQHFLTQEALKRKNDVRNALELYLKVLPNGTKQANSGEGKREKPIIPDKLCGTLSLMFPVITCTLLSVRNMLPWVKECVDRVIVDESGMIPLHYTFPLLVRSRKAIVVGDPLQIEPIVNQSQQTLDRYFQQAFVDQALSQADYYRYSPNEINTATTYHRAAGVTEEDNDPGEGIRLLEHYRCQPNIIAYCERIAKYGLIPKTIPKESLIGQNLVAYHVEGNITANVNREEIAAIHEIIQHLVRYGYSPNEIGVISAFRAQADALKKSLVEKFPGLKDAIGTVHTFQGSQRRVIILSTKVCRRQDSITWINRRPNLLNVAVSRAKELFILVGNLHHLEEEKSGIYTRQLVEHIREKGVILEYKTAAEVNPERFSSPGSSLIYDCDHLTTFEKALQEAEQELYIIAPRIQGEAAHKFSQDVISALKRGVSVTVIYGSPNDSNRLDEARETQSEKRLKELFVKYPGASLIHAKRDGTNERILVCDRKFAIIGSWNWLSHVYLSTCKQQKITEEAQIRRETSVRLSETISIEEIRETINELIQNSL